MILGDAYLGVSSRTTIRDDGQTRNDFSCQHGFKIAQLSVLALLKIAITTKHNIYLVHMKY